MTELNATDYSLLSWVFQAAVPAHSLSIYFHPHSLMVHCQSLEDAMRLWEKRFSLQMPERELCFQVDGTVYVAAAMG